MTKDAATSRDMTRHLNPLGAAQVLCGRTADATVTVGEFPKSWEAGHDDRLAAPALDECTACHEELVRRAAYPLTPAEWRAARRG